jgi:hypothetical protein
MYDSRQNDNCEGIRWNAADTDDRIAIVVKKVGGINFWREMEKKGGLKSGGEVARGGGGDNTR